jgi:plastocyanin
MVKKEVRELKENVKSSDSLHTTVTRRVIIPANFTNLNLDVNYFQPRFKKVNKGEDITWINEDSENHHLEFYRELSNDNFELLFESGVIEPSNSFQRKFDFEQIRIDYVCRLHHNEVGAVIIYQIPEDEMTNTQRLKFLNKAFSFEPDPPLENLRSQ